jgi:type IV pilus biogenesis protein CpaD/CtpE
MDSQFSRRGLGRRAALAIAAATAAPAQPQGQAALDPADQAEVDAKFAEVVRKYGSRLSDDQKNRVRGVIGRHQRMLTRVRAFTVENGDAPATGLRLYPSDTGLRKG